MIILGCPIRFILSPEVRLRGSENTQITKRTTTRSNEQQQDQKHRLILTSLARVIMKYPQTSFANIDRKLFMKYRFVPMCFGLKINTRIGLSVDWKVGGVNMNKRCWAKIKFKLVI